MITSGVDALSRPYKFARGSEADRDDWRLCDHAFQWLQQVAGVVFTVDRMASRANRRCTQFCSQSSVDPESFGVSAFAVDWSGRVLYSMEQPPEVVRKEGVQPYAAFL